MQRERSCNRAVTLAAVAVTIVTMSLIPAVSAAQEASPHRVAATTGVVAADHPQASQVGATLMEQGGNAVDAVVGTLLTLGVVNPFASGLGGGGFCLVKPIGAEATVIDFRERAPGKASRDMYVRDGEVDMETVMRGGLAVAVPGEVKGLEALHQKYGRLPWAQVVAPARKLAADGFVVGELMPTRLAFAGERMEGTPALAAAYKKDGEWVEAGATMKNPGLGKLLALIEKQGADVFYSGDVAKAIADAVQAAGGLVTTDDLTAYEVTWRDPVRGTYRGYEVLSMPPPSAGGTTLIATLNILERFDLPTLGYNPEGVHRFVEAMKHGYADRAQWGGDADFVQVPVKELTSKEAAAKRRVRPSGVLPVEAYGHAAPPPDDAGTSHVSIIDPDGSMVACTSTINTIFGSMVYVPEYGLVLNNEMGDFTVQPGKANRHGFVSNEQNAIEPHKRPMSSMTPTLVLKDGQPMLTVGGSGGPTIISGTLLALVGVLDWGWDPLRAVSEPRIHHSWIPTTLYVEEMSDAWKQVLERRGHTVETRRAYNSVQMVLRQEDGTLIGASDPRKMGHPAAVHRTEEVGATGRARSK